jgi:hypothetical protein
MLTPIRLAVNVYESWAARIHRIASPSLTAFPPFGFFGGAANPRCAVLQVRVKEGLLHVEHKGKRKTKEEEQKKVDTHLISTQSILPPAALSTSAMEDSSVS